MNYRRLALLVGVATLGVGLIASLAPGLVAVSLDRTLVSGIGVVILVQALRVVQTRRHGDLEEATTPDPELPIRTSAPGTDLERVLEQFLDTQRVSYRRAHVRTGLRSAAVAVLTQYEGYSEADAKAAVAAGTWTDDSSAAAFLRDGSTPAQSVRTRLRNLVRRESTFQRDVRHTVDAIAAVAGLEFQSTDAAETTSRRFGPSWIGSGRGDVPTRFSTAIDADRDEFDETADIVARDSHSTGRWRGVSVVALVGLGAGILVEQPAVLLAGVVGIGFAAYARSSAFSPGRVSVERTLSTDHPDPGDDVEVTVTVTNESDRVLPDLRIVDGVPEALAVSDGAPRFGTALRPGERTTFTYTVTARRGVHTFRPALLVARDLSAAIEQERYLYEETRLTCVPSLRPVTEPVPLRNEATQYVGRVETETSGEGVEFYATREYRPGDGMSRIDWNRRARTGELTTIEFCEERAATVVIVIDARESAYVSPAASASHAVDRAVDAAGQLFTTVADSGNRVGITALNSESCWLAPDSGDDHRIEARTLLGTHPALAPVPTEGRSLLFRRRSQLRQRLSPGTQVIFLTPLCDESGTRFARRLDEHGFPVTVISPDPTADRTAGQRLSQVARLLRLSSLRRSGIPAVDWSWDESVDAALARHTERWNQ